MARKVDQIGEELKTVFTWAAPKNCSHGDLFEKIFQVIRTQLPSGNSAKADVYQLNANELISQWIGKYNTGYQEQLRGTPEEKWKARNLSQKRELTDQDAAKILNNLEMNTEH